MLTGNALHRDTDIDLLPDVAVDWRGPARLQGPAQHTHTHTQRDAELVLFKDPIKYTRSGQIRESFALHNLHVHRHCAPQLPGQPTPGLEGLPVQLPARVPLADVFLHQGNVQHLFPRGLAASTSRHLRREGAAAWGARGFRSCALVGNSGNLLHAKYGAMIDRHDAVMRLNQAPVSGYEDHVGSKTTFRLLNNLWLHRYSQSVTSASTREDSLQPPSPTELPMERGATIILTRFTREEAEQFTDFWDKKRDISLLLLSSRVVSVVRQLLIQYRERMCQAGYGPYQGGTAPTSGLVGIYLLLQHCESVTAYGFGLSLDEKAKKYSNYHYYASYGARRSGNMESHSFEAELALMRELLSSERLHPPEGHAWYNPKGTSGGKLKMCRPNDQGPMDVMNYKCMAGNP
mmetsp:Transcript_17342/g.33383  ORF Transcript_17342/g.33383 Transcript_17342/m.33383 type:complete len:404 (+) Transcript_17342:152-1363(+)